MQEGYVNWNQHLNARVHFAPDSIMHKWKTFLHLVCTFVTACKAEHMASMTQSPHKRISQGANKNTPRENEAELR